LIDHFVVSSIISVSGSFKAAITVYGNDVWQKSDAAMQYGEEMSYGRVYRAQNSSDYE